MIFRAIFWIGLVALLMPREPDLGFGRPAALDTAVVSDAAGWANAQVSPALKDPHNLCRYNSAACAAGASMLDEFRAATMRSLAEVKADIETNGGGRAKAGGG